jgi:tetratricopeptide (TPR) repeat protein
MGRSSVRAIAFAVSIALVTSVCIALPDRARAQRADAQARALLDQGRTQYADLDYGEAVESLTTALRLGERDDAFRAEVLETLALTYFVMDREDSARDALGQLFSLDAYYVVREPSGSPRVARFVEAVRSATVRDAAIDPSLAVRTELPRSARADVSVEIAITIAAPVTRVAVLYRTDTSASWERVEAAPTAERARYLAVLPALSDAAEVDLYVEGRDARGCVVARDAGPLAPRTLEVTAPDRPRGGEGGGDLASEPWLWILVGVAVVGAGVGIGVGVALSDPGIPTGTLNPGIVRLP